MFDDTAPKTAGMTIVLVTHPVTGLEYELDFHIAESHKQCILGLEACLLFDLLHINEENLCEMQADYRQAERSTGLIAERVVEQLDIGAVGSEKTK